jgi:hypothetical protein
VRTEAPQEIEGMLMLTTLLNGELLQMNNVEIAPGNFGYNKKYDLVAGCLIAYACLISFKFGQNEYRGFLSFESKTVLIGLYQRKYGATVALGQKMFFDDIAGKRLILKYLGVDLSEIEFNHG